VTANYYLSNFIENVYHDLGNPDDYPVFRLSGWFLDNANIGKLNNLIGTSFSGSRDVDSYGNITGYSIQPEMGYNELAIYKMLFDYEYFKNMTRDVARSAVSSSSDWISLKEGDSSITRVNKNELSKNFRGLASDAKKDLDSAVKMYLKYNSVAEQVAGDDTFGQYNYISTYPTRNNTF
jgi:hypothetical protein